MGDLAYAMGPLPGGGGGAAGGLSALIPLVLMFAVFYFILIRPQQKKREHRQMMDALKTGDVVLTQGGLYGTIVGINESVVKLRIADNVKVDVARSSVSAKVEKVPGGKEKEKEK